MLTVGRVNRYRCARTARAPGPKLRKAGVSQQTSCPTLASRPSVTCVSKEEIWCSYEIFCTCMTSLCQAWETSVTHIHWWRSESVSTAVAHTHLWSRCGWVLCWGGHRHQKDLPFLLVHIIVPAKDLTIEEGEGFSFAEVIFASCYCLLCKGSISSPLLLALISSWNRTPCLGMSNIPLSRS